MQKKIYFFLSLCFVNNIMAINPLLYFSKNPDQYYRSARYCLGAFGVGVSGTNILTSPDLSLVESTMNAGCFLMCLHNFLYDLPGVPLFMKKISIPLLGACILAARTRDTNRSLLDHLRALSAGAMITTGIAQLINKFLPKSENNTMVAYGLMLCGALLLSQKDIKSFFGFQKGYSLNPPLQVKELIKSSFEKKIDVDRIVLQCAEEGRLHSLPFIIRLFSSYNPKCLPNQTPFKVSITEPEFVNSVLSNLRTEKLLKEIPNDDSLHMAFSVDPNTTAALRCNHIRRYMSVEAYNNSTLE